MDKSHILKRIVFCDASTMDPLFVVEGVIGSAKIVDVSPTYISKLCSGIKTRRKPYPFEEIWTLMYASKWEEENDEYLPGHRIELK